MEPDELDFFSEKEGMRNGDFEIDGYLADICPSQTKEHGSVIINLKQGSKSFKISSEVAMFSDFLMLHYSDELQHCQKQQSKKGTEKVSISIQAPQCVPLGQRVINILQFFAVQSCKWIQKASSRGNDLSTIKVGFIAVHDYLQSKSKSPDFEAQICRELRSFMELKLTALSVLELKNLIALCEFLQTRLLLQMIYLFLAEKYIVSFGVESREYSFQRYQVNPRFDEEGIIALKRKYYDFFNTLSSDLENPTGHNTSKEET